jgi:PAS domain S-box-containing protein
METHAHSLRNRPTNYQPPERELKLLRTDADENTCRNGTTREDGMVLFDRDLRCLAWNSLMERLTGVHGEDLSSELCWGNSSIVRRLGIHDQVMAALQGKSIAGPNIVCKTNSGEAIWFAPACSPLRDKEGHTCGVMVILRNITENKRIEETLVRTQVELGEEPEPRKGSWQWDIKTDITSCSEHFYQIIGRSPRTVAKSFKEHSCFYTSDSWDSLTAATLHLLQTGSPYELELRMLRSDGTLRSVMINGKAVRDSSGDILRLSGTIEDITELKSRTISGQRELESIQNVDCMRGRLLQAQEDDITRLSMELRDTICQKLCLLAAGLQGLIPAFPELPQQANMRIDELWRSTTEIVSEIALVSHKLHPYKLDLLGLPVAVQGYCREFTSRNGIPVKYSCKDVHAEKVEDKVALTFFRVLEDALSNVAKHSHACNVGVDLVGSSREVLLRVSDNGTGFELQQTKVTTGLGFIRMTERLRAIGGELAVWSAPTCGTRIDARAPLEKFHE